MTQFVKLSYICAQKYLFINNILIILYISETHSNAMLKWNRNSILHSRRSVKYPPFSNLKSIILYFQCLVDVKPFSYFPIDHLYIYICDPSAVKEILNNFLSLRWFSCQNVTHKGGVPVLMINLIKKIPKLWILRHSPDMQNKTHK